MARTSSELKIMARNCLRGRYGIPMVAFVIITLVSNLATAPFNNHILNNQTVPALVVGYLGNLLVSLLSAVLEVGFYRILLQMARNRSYSLGDLLFAFRNGPDRYIIALLASQLILAALQVPVGILLYLGNIRLYVDNGSIYWTSGSLFWVALTGVVGLAAGIFSIVLSLSFALITPLLLDHPDMRPLEAISRSMSMMRGHKGRLCYIYISFLGWLILGALSFCIGMLWVAPYMLATSVFFYLDLSGELDHRKEAL